MARKHTYPDYHDDCAGLTRHRYIKHVPNQPQQSTVITRIAVRLLEQAGNDYARHPAMRPSIESWLQGDDAMWPFADVCTVLRISDKETVQHYIRTYQVKKRERKHPVASNQEELTDGSLAADRERVDEPGHTGPERLLSGQGSLDRAEGGEQSTILLAEQLGKTESQGRGARMFPASI